MPLPTGQAVLPARLKSLAKFKPNFYRNFGHLFAEFIGVESGSMRYGVNNAMHRIAA